MHTYPVLKNERVSGNMTFGCKKRLLDALFTYLVQYLNIGPRLNLKHFVWPDYLYYILSRRFDLHDTEDCPTQSMQQQQQEELEETDSPNKSLGGHTRSGGVRGASRSYCDKCEVFGHETSTCDVADSY